ncbi:MAG: biotin transporter BioY [Candidatus Latescibacteria bacterium]|nr:biotin transporter BioY [Candidatus Latescibacterota bacterium]NIM21411.1 biotin transporter BioY [Candidatus Latescibacterota bacterium]NIM65592.1 biotin transporter BioY [Candidatus Latescibacterota bacterium]NIO01972.1 biotin transporter BioY [Candidatus Latescibacterota bacterium]NIO77615.1 biotin transporter BioY [Candidatus Latescibacterota bacterium]
MKYRIADSLGLRPYALDPSTRRILACTSGSILFAGLYIVGAYVRIPLYPVPVTLQTLFVLLSGAVLGGGFGALAGAIYLLLGASGLPVLAGSGGGLAGLASPTGGYLIGFLVAPVLVGRLFRNRTSYIWSIVVFSIGSLTVLAFGIAHLTLFYTHDFSNSLLMGLLPFIPGDALKVLAASSIYRSYKAIVHHRSAR